MLLVIGRGAVLVEWSYRCSCRMLLFCKVSTNVWFFVSLCSLGSGTVYDGLLAYLDGVLCVSDVFPVSTVAHFGGRIVS